MRWSKEEIDLLYKFYTTDKTENILIHFPNRSASQIRKKAKRLNLKKEINFYKKNDCSFLLEETNLSYYWMGFILADGNITNNNKLRICLSAKDIDHLEKFSKIIHKEIKRKNTYCGISLMDTSTISKLKEKFDIHHNKTYSPPSLKVFEKLDENKFISLLIGYIDGDGRITNQYKRKTSLIIFQIHSSWLDFLNLIVERLSEYCKLHMPSARINKRGYAYLSITNTPIVRYLKQKCLTLNIPYMRRKWDLIDETLMSKYEISDRTRKTIVDFENMGLTRKEISSKMGLYESEITKILKHKTHEIV